MLQGVIDRSTIEEYVELEKEISAHEAESPALILQQKKNHRILDKSRKYKENTDNKIEVNSIQARGYWSLFSKNNKIVITKRQFDPLFVWAFSYHNSFNFTLQQMKLVWKM